MNYNIINTYKTMSATKLEHFYQNIGEDWFTYPNLYRTQVERVSDNAHFVEVGSWKGRSAAFMGVEIWNSGKHIKFDCVDTWEGSVEHKEYDVIKEQKLYDLFLKNIEPVKAVVNPIRTRSLDAAKNYADGSLDFVFIDASHEYPDVVDDINAWLPKVKVGGVLAGHDVYRDGVSRAAKDTLGEVFTIDEGCWIYEKKAITNTSQTEQTAVQVTNEPTTPKEITFVTGLWDLGRNDLTQGWSRSYEHYLTKFEELLKIPYNLIVFGDEQLEKFVFERRSHENTQFIRRDVESFRQGEFYPLIQKIRNDEKWKNLAGWLPESTQAKLELYNPLVMSKMFFLNDARILNKFNSSHMFWIDAGLTNTVHYGYFTDIKLMNRLTKYCDKFSFICFPYEAVNEIHGFEFNKINEFAGATVKLVGRGGFFGGPVETISEVNHIYYGYLKDTLNQGYMGTEESIFSIIVYKYSDIVNYFEINGDGLIYKFFDGLGQDNLKRKTAGSSIGINTDLDTGNVGLYVLTFNSPRQFKTLIDSMLRYDKNFIEKPQKFLLDNSTKPETLDEYLKICKEYNFTHIKKDNIGICGGRQFCAEHAHENNFDFHIFFEDDMFFYDRKDGYCSTGFNRYVPDLYNSSILITKKNDLDFLKLCFTEVFGNNSTQWSWYNVPQSVREKIWPNYCKLPAHGLDPNAPKVNYNNILSYKNIPYATGEVYYCNWPSVITKYGNKKMFIDTKWGHPYEQTWMSHIFQLTKEGSINGGILLLSPIEHNRFEYYPGTERREN